MKKNQGILLLIALALTACSASLPPAIPEDRTIFAPPAAPAPEPLSTVPVSPEPVIQPSLEELQVFAVPPKPGRPEPPAKVIDEANAGARMTPTRQGYANGTSAIQRYPYLPGRLYDIYTSPNHPTTILLPPGERLAAVPTLNPDAWDVGVAEMGEDGTRQEAVIIRPLTAGQEGSTPLLTQSGKLFLCRLRSFEHTSMLAVTWVMPTLKVLSLPNQEPPSPRLKAPTIDVSRLHTAYKVEKVKGSPPWVPISVYDDSSKTVIRFKESLSYTNAPAVFVRHADGKAGLVEWTPYEVPDAPEKGAYYLINGLWPQLDLKGSDGQLVRITRQTGQPKTYTEGQ